MNPTIDPSQLSYEQLLELVRQLTAEIGRLRAENTHLREEIEQLKRKNARSAAPFSKNQRKQDPKRPGRKPGRGEFRNRPMPSEEDYSGPPVEVPVTETVCPDCGGDLMDDCAPTASPAAIKYRTPAVSSSLTILSRLARFVTYSTSTTAARDRRTLALRHPARTLPGEIDRGGAAFLACAGKADDPNGSYLSTLG